MVRCRYGIRRIRTVFKMNHFPIFPLLNSICDVIIKAMCLLCPAFIIPFHTAQIMNHVPAAEDQIALIPESAKLLPKFIRLLCIQIAIYRELYNRDIRLREQCRGQCPICH